jgi:hypothetical protein
MARKEKIDNSLLKRLERQKNSGRRQDVRLQRKSYLIVCEGERTEPNYFIGLEKSLPKGILSIEIVGTGFNTLEVVNEAIRLRNKDIDRYDFVWAVFDKDSFPAERYNAAIQLAEKESIGCAYSNEAFELWYLLHFEFLNVGISRNLYWEKLSTHFGKEYKKNEEKIYEILSAKGNQTQAIKFAQKLLKDSKATPAERNPSTNVHELVKQLESFK